MKKIHIHHRSPHHSRKSGYSRISEYMDAEVVDGTNGFPYRLAKLISSLHSQKEGIYDTRSFLKECGLFSTLRKNKVDNQVVHYLNAERDIRHLVRYRDYFSKTTFCGTFHKPPDALKNTILNTSCLSGLNGVIAVGTNQVEFLQEWLKVDHIEFIPHGVDTDFFRPSHKRATEKNILFVGQHLRDFETFNRSMEVILQKFPNIVVNVVLHKAYTKFVLKNDAIRFHNGLSDEQLLTMYQKATLLFLPLQDVTACNSILEALSCGLPIITSEVGSNPSYFQGSANILVPKYDADACIEEISKLLVDEDEQIRMGLSSRNKSLEFDWSIITKQTLDFYEKLSLIS